VRVPTGKYTDRQTQTDFIICPMLYAVAMGLIKTCTYQLCKRQLADTNILTGRCRLSVHL